MERFSFIILSGFLAISVVSSQSLPSKPDIRFNHLTEQQGLSYNQVTGLELDTFGYAWISTLKGLNRFDGKRYEVFLRGDKGMPSHMIHGICMDHKGLIWGATEDAIFSFNPVANLFTSYYCATDSLPPMSKQPVCDTYGRIWVSSEYGLISVDKQNGKFIHKRNNPRDSFSISSNHINQNGILTDPYGRGLWIATRAGLNFFDFSTGRFSNFTNQRNKKIYNHHSVAALYQSPSGHVWMVDEQLNELVGFDPISEKILYRIPLSAQIQQVTGGTIFESCNHQLWYASESYEIVRINYTTGIYLQKISHDPANPFSIRGDFFRVGREDRDGTIWLGTNAGISRYNPGRDLYHIIPLPDRFPEMDQNWYITCLTEDPIDKTWWIGARNGMMYSYNLYTGESHATDLKKYIRSSQSPGFVSHIECRQEELYICMINHPPLRVKRSGSRILSVENLLPVSHVNYIPLTLGAESDSTWLLSNNMLPVLRWYPFRQAIEEINLPDDSNLSIRGANWLKVSKDKGSWIAISNRIMGFIPSGKNELIPVHLFEEGQRRKGGYINTVWSDSSGNAWIGYTGHGLFHVYREPDGDSFIIRKWNSTDGLANEQVQSAVADQYGRIWSVAFNKFSVLDKEKNRFFNFKINLSEHNSFYFNYLIPLSDGRMLTNIKGNLVMIYPEKLVSEYPAGKTVISKVTSTEDVFLLYDDREIRLTETDNFIAIGFGSLSPPDIYDYRFEYKLEGVNAQWVTSGQGQEAVYSQLAPGKYNFMLRAISTDEQWMSEIRELHINIASPFYKRGWFLFSIGLALVLLVISISYQRYQQKTRIRDLNSKAQMLEKEKTSVMYEQLKQQLNPHFLFNSLSSLGSLIRLDPPKASKFLDDLSKVYRYVLKNKDNELVTLADELTFVQMYVNLQKTRFEDKLIFKSKIQTEHNHFKIAPVTIQNLVENAIKHNIADEETPLIIEVFIENDYLLVRNNLQRKTSVETSNKLGQAGLISFYKYLTIRPVVIEETQSHYTVKIPLI